jgi:alpha-L-fucosidase
MFIHYGTCLGKELPDGQAHASTYAPTDLDVDQWVQVARDAGMKYASIISFPCVWFLCYAICNFFLKL